jgi:hypothetical protein
MVSAGALALVLATTPSRAEPMSTSPEQAYDLGEIPSARAVAMGGALRALGVSTPALYLNPANMPLARVYHLEALGAFSPEAKRETFGLAAVDSITSRVAGGLGGTWSRMDPDGIHRTWTDVRAALALPLGDYVAIGATGRWLHVDQSVAAGPFGPSLASDGTRDGPVVNTLTFDVGTTVTLGESVRAAVVGQNLTNPGTALAPTTASAGIGYFSSIFSLEGDALLDFTTWGKTRSRLMVGAELFLADRYALRAGWRYDDGTKLNGASLGFGYIDPRWSVEISARRDLTSDHGSTLAVLSLRYFYDAVGAASPADQPDVN